MIEPMASSSNKAQRNVRTRAGGVIGLLTVALLIPLSAPDALADNADPSPTSSAGTTSPATPEPTASQASQITATPTPSASSVAPSAASSGGVNPAVVAPQSVSPTDATPVPELRSRDTNPTVNPSTYRLGGAGNTTGAVQPDMAYTAGNGSRVEVYSSIGNLEKASDQDWRQVDQFAYMINSTPKYAHIYATVYNSLWDGDVPKKDGNGKWYLPQSSVYAPTQAFMNQLNQYDSSSDQRSYIHVLGNKKTINDAVKAKSSLGLLLTQAGVIKNCSLGEGACMATTLDGTPLMHAKYALFEKTNDSTGKQWSNVIWITSANLNSQSGGNKSNFSIAIYGDASGYNGLLNNVWNIVYNAPQAGYYGHNYANFPAAFKSAAEQGVGSDTGQFTFYPSPRRTDHEARLLDAADAQGGKTGCSIYLVHSLYSTARSDIANSLQGLQNDGCTVRLILGNASMLNVADTYFSMGTGLRELIKRVEFANVHDKTVLINYYVGGARTSITFGGSANLNGTSLYFDELAFASTSPQIADAEMLQVARLYPISRVSTKITKVAGVVASPTGNTSTQPFTLNQGKSTQLTALVSPSNATVPSVYWRSSNPAVATVSAGGVVTGVAPGTVTIRATSYSNVKSGSSVITVVGANDPTRTPPASGRAPTSVSLTSPPVVTIQRYTSPGTKRKVVVTWGQGYTSVSGTVQLQYLTSSGSWKTSPTKVKVTNGYGSVNKTFTASNVWRVKALSAKTSYKSTSISSSARYSGYAPVVSRNKSAKSTVVRLYGTPAVKKGHDALFLIQWASPYDQRKYRAKMWLQYYNGRKWVTYNTDVLNLQQYYVIPAGGTTIVAKATITKTRRWRVVTSASALPKGKKKLASSSIQVRAA